MPEEKPGKVEFPSKDTIVVEVHGSRPVLLSIWTGWPDSISDRALEKESPQAPKIISKT